MVPRQVAPRLGFVASLLLAGACVAPQYALTDLGVLPGDTTSTVTDLNDAGQVVGISTGPGGDRAFVWSAATGMVEVGDLPGGSNWSRAHAINRSGQVVGQSVTWNNARHAFLWTPGQGMRDLGDLPGGGENSSATDVNAAGVVVGTGTTNQSYHAFRWTSGSGLQDLGAMSGVSDQSEAGAITDSGLVTGTFVTSGSVQAFIWDSANGMRKVAPLSAEGRATMGHAINSAGRIAGVGSSYLRPGFPSNVGRAISADLQILSVLPDLPGRPAGHSTDDSTAYGINDSNDVVGWTLDASGARAVIWGYKFGLRDLNDRIHPCDPLRQSVVLSDARAINNGGEIAAVGSIGGVAHAFLLRNAWTVWTANCQPVITRPPKTLSTAPP